MWYALTVICLLISMYIGLLISMYIGYKFTLAMDKHLDRHQQ